MAEPLYPITMPKWGIEMQEGTVTAWRVAVGASVAKGDELIDIETDKIVNTLEAPVAGVVCRQLVAEDKTLKVGELLGVIATAETNDSEIDTFVRDFVPADAAFGIDEETSPSPAASDSVAVAGDDIRVSPVARRLANKLGVDLSQIRGTGRNGRISKEDVEAAAAEAPAAADITPFSSRRQAIARRLVASKQAIPHYYVSRSVDTEHAMSLKSAAVSFNAVILKAVALALRDHPKLNCHVSNGGIKLLAAVDINVAVDTDEGLVAPLLREVDGTALADLTAAAAAIAEKARRNQLAPADMETGGFTVSNLGALGVESFTAIINPPQAAILAVGTAVLGRMNVTLSADHRVIDGADAARFLRTLNDRLQDIEP